MRHLSPGRALALVFALALLIRVIVVFATPHFVPATDSADYDRIAVSLADDGRFPHSDLTAIHGPTAFRGPAYPLALAAAYELSGTRDAHARWRAGRLEEALFGAIAVALIFLIALRIWNLPAALAAGLIGAIYPPLVLVGSSLMTESLFIPLMLAAVLSALHARDTGRLRWVVAAGALIALATLTRTIGIVLVPALGVLVWPGPRRMRPAALAAPLVLVAVTLVTLVPWAVRDAEVFHRFVPLTTESGYAFAGIYDSEAQDAGAYPGLWRPAVADVHTVLRAHPRYDEAQISSALNALAWRYVEHHPLSVLTTSFWNTVRMLNLSGVSLERMAALGNGYPPTLTVLSVYAFWLLALLAIAGCFVPGRPAARGPAAFWACPVLLFLANIPVIGTTRYRSPVDPFLVMLAALAVVEAARRLAARRNRGRLRTPPVPSAAG
jgi:4-amino-4-deoxy-L-arabinose transferase-like glycosyltransferase